MWLPGARLSFLAAGAGAVLPCDVSSGHVPTLSRAGVLYLRLVFQYACCH
jgi:hypothetical protein